MVIKNNRERRHDGFTGGELSEGVSHGNRLVDERGTLRP